MMWDKAMTTPSIATTIAFRLNPEYPNAIVPTKSHAGDLGFDLYAAKDYIIYENCGPIKIHTGIHCIFPDGFGGIIKDRSSMASKGYYTHGGVIDNGYTGEIIVLMSLVTPRSSNRGYSETITQGTKIAQMVLVPVYNIKTTVISESQFSDLTSDKDRGDNGFGSTDR